MLVKCSFLFSLPFVVLAVMAFSSGYRLDRIELAAPSELCLDLSRLVLSFSNRNVYAADTRLVSRGGSADSNVRSMAYASRCHQRLPLRHPLEQHAEEIVHAGSGGLYGEEYAIAHRGKLGRSIM